MRTGYPLPPALVISPLCLFGLFFPFSPPWTLSLPSWVASRLPEQPCCELGCSSKPPPCSPTLAWWAVLVSMGLSTGDQVGTTSRPGSSQPEGVLCSSILPQKCPSPHAMGQLDHVDLTSVMWPHQRGVIKGAPLAWHRAVPWAPSAAGCPRSRVAGAAWSALPAQAIPPRSRTWYGGRCHSQMWMAQAGGF